MRGLIRCAQRDHPWTAPLSTEHHAGKVETVLTTARGADPGGVPALFRIPGAPIALGKRPPDIGNLRRGGTGAIVVAAREPAIVQNTASNRLSIITSAWGPL